MTDLASLQRAAAGALLSDKPDLLGCLLNDHGNAERLIAISGHDLRYCHEMKKWLVWDGKRWAVDEIGKVRELAKRMARLLHFQAIGQTNIEKHARASESFAAITAAIGSTASRAGIPISANELDQQPL